MRKTTLTRLALPALLMMLLPGPALGHGKGHTNLQILEPSRHRDLKRGMKLFSKGLGMKCKVCHVPKQWEKDDRPFKRAARTFLEKALRTHSAAAREQALLTLLGELRLERPREEALIWQAVELWSKTVPETLRGSHEAHPPAHPGAHPSH